jgi:hypothetical protein
MGAPVAQCSLEFIVEGLLPGNANGWRGSTCDGSAMLADRPSAVGDGRWPIISIAAVRGAAGYGSVGELLGEVRGGFGGSCIA